MVTARCVHCDATFRLDENAGLVYVPSKSPSRCKVSGALQLRLAREVVATTSVRDDTPAGGRSLLTSGFKAVWVTCLYKRHTD